MAIDGLAHSRHGGVEYGDQQLFLPISVHVRDGKLLILDGARFPEHNFSHFGHFRPAQVVMDSPERPLERTADGIVPVRGGGFRLGGFCRCFHGDTFRRSEVLCHSRLRCGCPAAGGKKQHHRQHKTNFLFHRVSFL